MTRVSGERAPFTVLDWIGVILAGMCVTLLVVVPPFLTELFATMFRDLGGSLPHPTASLVGFHQLLVASHLRFASGVPYALAPGLLLALGLTGNAEIGRRRALVAGAFGLSFVICVLYVWILYLPLFAMADAIR